jgi:hypothetical protein
MSRPQKQHGPNETNIFSLTEKSLGYILATPGQQSAMINFQGMIAPSILPDFTPPIAAYSR